MGAVIKTVNLTKRYGTLIALSNLNLEIQEGDCFGFIGPNGAGKTTTIKILATLLQPTWGEARICDQVIGYQSRQIRPLIGYVPDYFGAYEDMAVQEYLEFFAAAYNINGSARVKIVSDVLELADLGNTVGIIEQGELLYSGSLADVVRKARGGTVLHVGVSTNQAGAAALLSQNPQIENVAANNGYLEVSLRTGVEDYSFVP